jgi:ParB family chromosome partitioning protein
MAVQKRGLGRGLDALLGHVAGKENAHLNPAALLTVNTDHSPQQTLPVEFLRRGKYQPRKDINPEKLQELADSIKAQGLIQPIVVRQVDTEAYEIVAGERRWRAAQLAGLADVPVVVKALDDRTAIAIALIENIQRQDLNPLEEAEAYKRLADEFNLTHQEIADAVGKSRVTVTNLLRLLELHPDVKKQLFRNQLEMGHARALLTLSPDKQIAAADKIIKDGLTVRATERLVKDSEKSPSTSSEKVKMADNDTRRLQERLSAKLGAKVAIDHKSNGSGKVVINYASLDELDGLIERFQIGDD